MIFFVTVHSAPEHHAVQVAYERDVGVVTPFLRSKTLYHFRSYSSRGNL